MKKLLLVSEALTAGAIVFVVIARVSAKQSDESSRGGDVVRVMRRDIASVVKATGVIKPLCWRGSQNE